MGSGPVLPAIELENSLTRKRERLEPAVPGRISMYVCGMTVYDDCHLGHAMSAVCFDMIRRYLEHRGFLVDYVVNFTDVDDKILARASREEVDFLTVSERFIDNYFSDMDRLNVKRATIYPRATRHIPEMLRMIGDLVDRDIAYPVDGDVYFDVTRFDDYGKLSGRKVEELLAGARIEADTRLRQPADFALWKGAKDGEPGWESPWGTGRPGWHIECSAMASRYLGQTFDIHGGGLDLLFPHHENEIAQSEAHAGVPFARYWLHNGILNFSGSKMSKSIGNVLGIKRLLKTHDPDAIRLYLLGSHYRQPQSYEDGSLERAGKSLERFVNVFDRARRLLQDSPPEERGSITESALTDAAAAAEARFHQCMSDDFNAAGALGGLFELASHLNTAMQAAEKEDPGPEGRAGLNQALSTLSSLLGVLGLRVGSGESQAAGASSEADTSLISALVDQMIQMRLQARQAKDFSRADEIRDRLARVGIELKDAPSGTTWTRRPPSAQD